MARTNAKNGVVATGETIPEDGVFIWWSHFGFISEPILSTNSAHLESEEEVFVGRIDEVEFLRELVESQNSDTVLLAGPAGSGKTSLVYHAFKRYPQFVRIDFAREMKPESFPYVLAMQLIDACASSSGMSTLDTSRVRQIQMNLTNETTITTAVTASASAKPLGMGVEASGSQATATKPVKIPDSDVSACRELAHILHRTCGGKLILSLDEADSDLVPGITPRYIMGLIRALEMPAYSVVVWPTRDTETRDRFSNPESSES